MTIHIVQIGIWGNTIPCSDTAPGPIVRTYLNTRVDVLLWNDGSGLELADLRLGLIDPIAGPLTLNRQERLVPPGCSMMSLYTHYGCGIVVTTPIEGPAHVTLHSEGNVETCYFIGSVDRVPVPTPPPGKPIDLCQNGFQEGALDSYELLGINLASGRSVPLTRTLPGAVVQGTVQDAGIAGETYVDVILNNPHDYPVFAIATLGLIDEARPFSSAQILEEIAGTIPSGVTVFRLHNGSRCVGAVPLTGVYMGLDLDNSRRWHFTVLP